MEEAPGCLSGKYASYARLGVAVLNEDGGGRDRLHDRLPDGIKASPAGDVRTIVFAKRYNEALKGEGYASAIGGVGLGPVPQRQVLRLRAFDVTEHACVVEDFIYGSDPPHVIDSKATRAIGGPPSDEWAVRHLIKLLRATGADLDQEETLHSAISSGKTELVNSLINNGVVVDKRAFDYALLGGSPELVRLLLDNGAILYVNDVIDGSPPLATAMRGIVSDETPGKRRAVEMVSLLLAHGADPNKAARGTFGQTPEVPLCEVLIDPWDRAVRVAVLKALLSAGADPNQVCSWTEHQIPRPQVSKDIESYPEVLPLLRRALRK